MPEWAYTVGNVRAKEATLLTKQDVEQMLNFNSESQLSQFMTDKGFDTENGMGKATVEEMLKNETAKVWEYAEKNSADFGVFKPFILSNDYHNLKVTIKGVLSNKPYSHLYLYPTTIDVDSFVTAVSEKKFDILPEFLIEPAAKAYEVLAHTYDAQLCDAILDKSRMLEELKLAKSTKVEQIYDYFELKIFFENVKIALRSAKNQKNAEFLETALLNFDGVCANELKTAALSSEKSVLEWLSRNHKFDGDQAAESYKISPSAFEKFVDNKLMSIAKIGKYTTIGAEVIVGYCLARLAEIRAISIIATGIRTQRDVAEIRERLRELYD